MCIRDRLIVVLAVVVVASLSLFAFLSRNTDAVSSQGSPPGGSVEETNPPVRPGVSSITTDVHSLRLVAVGPIMRLIIIDEGGASRHYEYKDIPEGWAHELQFTDSCRLWCSSLENLKFSVDGGADKMFGGSGPGSYALKPETNPTPFTSSSVKPTHSLRFFAVGPIKHLIVKNEGGFFPETNQKTREFKDLQAGWEGTLTFRDSFKCYCSSLENLRFFVDDGAERKIEGEGSGNFTWKPH